jgi:5-methylcytosine-specific restriction endonuclease McrA
MVSLPVLVLNQNYEPLNVCQVRRAIILLLRGKAEVLENGRGTLHSITSMYDIPSVIRLVSFIKRPHHRRKMTKLEIFNRDKYTCQYCGRQHKELTLDHVIPKKRGGEHSWENVVSACIPCNRRKAGRTPDEAGMPLLNHPKPPRNDGFHVPYHHLNLHTDWHKYLIA